MRARRGSGERSVWGSSRWQQLENNLFSSIICLRLRTQVFCCVVEGGRVCRCCTRPGKDPSGKQAVNRADENHQSPEFFKIWGAVRRGWAACTLFPGLLVSRLWHPRLTGQLLVPQREDPIVGGGGRASASLPGPLCRCGRQGTQPRSTSGPSSASRDYKVSHDEHGRRYCVENK